MTDDRKINEYAFSEMNFTLNNIINLTKNTRYIEGQLRIGAKVARVVQVKEIDGKVKIL